MLFWSLPHDIVLSRRLLDSNVQLLNLAAAGLLGGLWPDKLQLCRVDLDAVDGVWVDWWWAGRLTAKLFATESTSRRHFVTC